MKPLNPGDYVLATKYCDGDPQDGFAVGFYVGTLDRGGGDLRYLVQDDRGNPFRANGFRRVARISRERGAWLVARFPEIERGTRSVWWWRRAPMGREGVDSGTA